MASKYRAEAYYHVKEDRSIALVIQLWEATQMDSWVEGEEEITDISEEEIQANLGDTRRPGIFQLKAVSTETIEKIKRAWHQIFSKCPKAAVFLSRNENIDIVLPEE
jgi:hypothetical protein